jgi:RimJ/RimL family protein N-acetyltransferase
LIREAPRIETERLVLSAFEAKDLEPLAAMWADEGVYRYIGGQKLSREDTWRRSLAACGQWPFIGFGYWVAQSRADGLVVGQLGFADFKRDMQPKIEGEPEFGYVFVPRVHGLGIAGEACRAALDWADTNLNASSYPAIISAENVPSLRLAERLGFRREGEATYRGEPVDLFRRQRP